MSDKPVPCSCTHVRVDFSSCCTWSGSESGWRENSYRTHSVPRRTCSCLRLTTATAENFEDESLTVLPKEKALETCLLPCPPGLVGRVGIAALVGRGVVHGFGLGQLVAVCSMAVDIRRVVAGHDILDATLFLLLPEDASTGAQLDFGVRAGDGGGPGGVPVDYDGRTPVRKVQLPLAHGRDRDVGTLAILRRPTHDLIIERRGDLPSESVLRPAPDHSNPAFDSLFVPMKFWVLCFVVFPLLMLSIFPSCTSGRLCSPKRGAANLDCGEPSWHSTWAS